MNSKLSAHFEPDSARLAQSVGGWELRVVDGKEEGVVCLVVSRADTAMTNCGSMDALTNGALYLVRPNGNGTMDAWGIVADEVKRVQGTNVVQNTFIYQGPESRFLKMNTASEGRTLDLGPLHPPTTP